MQHHFFLSCTDFCSSSSRHNAHKSRDGTRFPKTGQLKYGIDILSVARSVIFPVVFFFRKTLCWRYAMFADVLPGSWERTVFSDLSFLPFMLRGHKTVAERSMRRICSTAEWQMGCLGTWSRGLCL